MTEPPLPRSQNGNSPITIAIVAARQAGAVLKDGFGQQTQVESKGKRNLVTAADIAAEETILELLKQEFPEHSVLSEESGKTGGESEFCWIVDPLDGTTNYAFGVPFFAVSIALARGDDVLLGVVHDPLRGELFHAQKGKGAILNGERIGVARSRNLETRLIGMDLGYNDICTRNLLSRLPDLWSEEVSFRLLGSAALGLTYVACGRLDIYLHAHLYPWDTAAAMLMIREAGGEVTDWGCKPATIQDTRIFACGDPITHDGIRTKLGNR